LGSHGADAAGDLGVRLDRVPGLPAQADPRTDHESRGGYLVGDRLADLILEGSKIINVVMLLI
jgi:hypothetical protein